MTTLPEISMKPDARLGREIGVIGRYADTPAYQIAHDAHGRIRHIIGRLMTARYGPHAELFAAHPRWSDINAAASDLQRRFHERSDDGFYAHLLLLEADKLRENDMRQMFEDIAKATA